MNWKPKNLEEALSDAIGSALNDNAREDGGSDYIRAKDFDKVIEDAIKNIGDIEDLSTEGKVMELCPECMAKHVIWLSEHGGISI